MIYYYDPAEIKRLNEIDLAERARLCDPLDIAAKRCELDRIMAYTARIAAKRRIQAKIAPFAVGEAA